MRTKRKTPRSQALSQNGVRGYEACYRCACDCIDDRRAIAAPVIYAWAACYRCAVDDAIVQRVGYNRYRPHRNQSILVSGKITVRVRHNVTLALKGCGACTCVAAWLRGGITTVQAAYAARRRMQPPQEASCLRVRSARPPHPSKYPAQAARMCWES